MTASVDVSCEGNVVNVKAKDKPLEGAEVKVLKFYSKIFNGTTNAAGQFGFKELNGHVLIELVYFEAKGNCYMPPIPLGCNANAACPENYVCIDGKCEVKLKTSEECAPKPCADCPAGNICVDNKCVAPPPPPPPPKPECTTNSDCAQDKYCSTEGITKGKCVPVVTGPCGHIVNHAWENYTCCADNYTCCSDKDCPENNACENNRCRPKNYDLKGDDSGLVGDSNEVTAYVEGGPLGGAQLRVTKPDGSSEFLTAGPDGLVTLSLLLQGTYTIDLLVDESVVKSFEIVSLPKTPVQPPEEPSIFDVIAGGGWLLLIIILAGAVLVYWYATGKKK